MTEKELGKTHYSVIVWGSFVYTQAEGWGSLAVHAGHPHSKGDGKVHEINNE
jgi:hypothetical protein